MLVQLKNLIFKNLFLASALFLTTLFLYLSFKNIYFLFPLFFILLFFNFYYFRGYEILLATFLIPLPFFFSELFFKFPFYYYIIFWPIYYLIFTINKKFGWTLNLFFNIFILNNFFQIFSIFISTLVFGILSFLIFFFAFKEDIPHSLLKTIFSLEIFWLLFLGPFPINLRTIFNFIFFIWILNKKIL